ncbi:biliverdin-producing heme oxygenase [Allorhizobium undicola]|uniref:biliverdin-producing heme oxygenase n=1 Tax=Allorhizobium undicola TaxID=78527 RepID=UPI0004866ACC|nr:biliverdin-producing heme oxygenase [Allorhizobium undicola]
MDFSPVRQFLRRETASLHKDLDRLVGEFSSRSAYQAFLAGSAGFRLPLEAVIAAHDLPDAFGQWRPALVGSDIMADLGDLEMTPRPVSQTEPAPERTENWLGMIYVLEGSSLGAQLLARRAAELGLSQTFGARHIFAQARNISNWRAFSGIMDGMQILDWQALSDSAIRTFRFAYRAYESSLECRLA